MRSLIAAASVALALAAATVAAPSAEAAPAPRAPASHGQADTPGCGTEPAVAPGSSATLTLESGGIERSAIVHVPAAYDPLDPTPVVLAFHGRGSTGAEIQAFSGIDALPAIAVYPEGVPTDGRQAWQGAPYAAPGVDDVAFVDDLLDAVEAGYCVDERRILATGKSNGGGLVALLACTSSDRIAAFVPVAGAYYPGTTAGCDGGAAAPVLAFHGTADATIAYEGGVGNGEPYLGVGTWLDGWADRDGCVTSTTRPLTADTTSTTWRGCDRGLAVEHVAVVGGGHTWPGALAYSGGGYATQSISATELAWAFLLQHPLARC